MVRPLYAYTYADAPFDAAIRLLAEAPERLLQEATDASTDHGHEVLTTLHAEVAGHELARDVVVRLGDFQPRELLRAVVPIHWEAARGHLWFPTLDATLEIAALSDAPPTVQVILAGGYRPPLGPLGAVLDAAAAHWIAEATAARFVREVAERLERLAEEWADPVPATV